MLKLMYGFMHVAKKLFASCKINFFYRSMESSLHVFLITFSVKLSSIAYHCLMPIFLLELRGKTLM